MKQLYYKGVFILITFASYAQVTTGHFGSNKTLDGVVQPHHSHTTNKWIKLAELTINGNWNPTGITVDFFPRNSNHGDSRQQLNVQFRNNRVGIESSYDISLVTFYGQQKTLNDVKVVHTSGSGISNNKLSVWVQIGISWLSYVPIEVRTYGRVTFKITNQPCYTSVQDRGKTFGLKTYYGMTNDKFEVAGNIRAKEVKVELENWPDYVFAPEYDLLSLTEVKSHIVENGHLPNIPTAATVVSEGISLGEMNAKILQKIEELTLYTIAQEEKLQQYQQSLSALQARFTQMESQMKDYEKHTFYPNSSK